MPPEERVPICPQGVAVSRPKRDSWLIEELLDTLVPEDPGARVEATRYPGVLLVYSSLRPARLAKLVYSGYHSFMKRFVPSQFCSIASSVEDLEAFLESSLSRAASGGRLRVMVSLRGVLKRLGGERAVRSLLSRLGYSITRDSSLVLAVESVDEVVVAALGNTRRCGPDCVTIAFEE